MVSLVKIKWINKLLLVAGQILFHLPVLSQTDSSIWQMKMGQIVHEAAGKQSKITGGAISISSAALNTALSIMALEISAKKEKDSTKKLYLDSIISVLRKDADSLAYYADEDIKVFRNFLSVNKLPRSTKDEVKTRDSLYYLALLEATKTPIKSGKLMVAILHKIENVTPYCNAQLISDLGAGALVIQSSLEAVLLFAEANIQLLKKADKDIYEKERKIQLNEGEKLATIIMQIVWYRMKAH